MQTLSREFKDRPMTPEESIVYWTEYVIKHNGTSHLRTLGTNMPLYKYLMLDILVLFIFIFSSMVYIIYAALRRIFVLGTKKPTYPATLIKKYE